MPMPNFMPPPERQFYNLGALCAHMQLLPPAVLAIASEAGVEPHEWRDGCPVFRGDGVEKICDHVNRTRAAIADAEAKVENAPSN